MNDLTMLREFGTTLDPVDTEPPTALRDRVLSATSVTNEQVPQGRQWTVLGTWPRLAAVSGLAAAIAAGLIVVSTVSFGHHTPAANAQAAEVLRDAARAAAIVPVLAARPDQFVFIETVNQALMISAQPDKAAVPKPGTSVPPGREPAPNPSEYGQITDPGAVGRLAPPAIRQDWMSVDGTHDGLIDRSRPMANPTGWGTPTPAPGCRDGAMATVQNGKIVPGNTYPCAPHPAYRTDLPTNPSAMLRYLYAASDGQNSREQQAFITVGDLIRNAYLTPASRSALFDAAALIPGVIVVPDVVISQ